MVENLTGKDDDDWEEEEDDDSEEWEVPVMVFDVSQVHGFAGNIDNVVFILHLTLQFQ